MLSSYLPADSQMSQSTIHSFSIFVKLQPLTFSPLKKHLSRCFFYRSLYCGYNKDMKRNDYQEHCWKCGRAFPKAQPKCNYCDACLTEYPCVMPACIRKNADPCKAKAVIPAVTTETVDGITNLANCFVHVTNINTTFYIDDKHRPMITWAGPLEVDNYDYATNPLGLRSQTVYDFTNNRAIVFNKRGEYRLIDLRGV